VIILTNGTVIRRDLVEIFRHINLRFQVSLDGPDPLRHDEIRGAGNFDKSVRGIRELIENGFEVSVLSILSKKTSAWIGDFFELSKNLGVNAMNFTRFIPEGYGKTLFSSGQDSPLSPVELRDAMQGILYHSIQTGVSTNTNQPLFHLLDDRLGRQNMAGFQGLIVDYRGNLKFSSRSNYLLGNIFEQGLEPLFLHHPLMKALRKGDIEGCGQCKFYTRCGGNRSAAYAAAGSFLTPDPGCWILQEEKQRRVS
jgi:radical SAM protein with 4Fe4S-binding SPASM domain